MTISRRFFYQCSAVFLVTLALTTSGFAGEIHEGRGRSRNAALDQANRAARDAALRKETGWKPARVQEARQNADGSWTARADSANHEGSLDRGGYLRPTAPLPVYDEEEPPRPTPAPTVAKPRTASEGSGGARPDLVGTWQNETGSASRTLHLKEDGTFASEMGSVTRTGTWRADGLTLGFENDNGQSRGSLTLSEDNRLTGKAWLFDRPLLLSLNRTGTGTGVAGEGSSSRPAATPPAGQNSQTYLFFAAIFKRTGDLSEAKVVEDKVETRAGAEGAIEAEFSKMVESKYETSFNTWVIHVVPQTTHAVIYSYTMDNGRTKGIAVAEGQSPAEAESNMRSQAKRFNRANVDVVRWWPTDLAR